MKKIMILLLGLISLKETFAQKTDSTYQLLDAVTVEAFAYERPLQQTPVSIGILNDKDLDRFNTTSLVWATNTIPGVRMEERSPGSYRFSIRGSTLRSPYGVRNVKVYLDGLPFTDPGGNSYLNLIDNAMINRIEVVKGPGGSNYGAGTGGVLLLKASPSEMTQKYCSVTQSFGSFGLLKSNFTINQGSEKNQTNLQLGQQRFGGFRERTAMKRGFIKLSGHYAIKPDKTLHANILFSDLFYELPGGLNKEQFLINPQQARPGMAEKRTAIFNKTFFVGLSQEHHWNEKWTNKTGIYGSFTKFDNPFITNYEKHAENSLGVRSVSEYWFEKGKLSFGAEFQTGYAFINNYGNNNGNPDTVQLSQELKSNTGFLFSQLDVNLPSKFFLTIGGSLNYYDIGYSRLHPLPSVDQNFDISAVFSPRVALLKDFGSIAVFTSLSRGYSPPTMGELFPPDGVFNVGLKSERGNNIELGTRGNFMKRTLSFELIGYSFQLNETIVVQSNAMGEAYFINAGKTNQNGIEAKLTYDIIQRQESFFPNGKLWITTTLSDYKFVDYKKNESDFSNSDLPGVPSHVVIFGFDITTKSGLALHITSNQTDKIPLNDGNTWYSDAYWLLNVKLDWTTKNHLLHVFLGADNLLNESYSLGNDLNAFGGRYFNPSLPRNYYAGIKFNFMWHK